MADFTPIPRIKPDGMVDAKDLERFFRAIFKRFTESGELVRSSLNEGNAITLTLSNGYTTIAVTQAEASASIPLSTVIPSVGYDQDEIEEIVADLNVAIAGINDLKAKMRIAGLLDT